MRGALQSLALLAASLVFSAAAAELVLRWRLDPVDYLEPRLAPHPVLRHVIVPGSGSHDAWGFRNPQVPEHVEILAVGDSQTYGVSAPARESWPAWLERLSGRPVYNLSLGGYGPPDYRYLLRERGLSLHPEIVVIGIYLGNDLPRAADVASGRSRPSRALRGGEDPRVLGRLRSWLARHSVLYQALKFGLPGLTETLRFREAAGRDDAVAVEHPVSRTFLTPELRLRALDQERPRNRKGLEATLAGLEAVRDTCRAHALRCVHLLIPTKESVYWELAREQLGGAGYARLSRLVKEEEAVRRAIVGRLQELDLEWVDPLPALRAEVGETRLYPANADGHPVAAGYRTIAREVLRGLGNGGPR